MPIQLCVCISPFSSPPVGGGGDIMVYFAAKINLARALGFTRYSSVYYILSPTLRYQPVMHLQYPECGRGGGGQLWRRKDPSLPFCHHRSGARMSTHKVIRISDPSIRPTLRPAFKAIKDSTPQISFFEGNFRRGCSNQRKRASKYGKGSQR